MYRARDGVLLETYYEEDPPIVTVIEYDKYGNYTFMASSWFGHEVMTIDRESYNNYILSMEMDEF